MTRNERDYGTENRMRNPVPFVVIAMLAVLGTLIYYAIGPKETPVDARPSSSAQPTTVTVIDDKPEQTVLTVEEIESILKPASDLITSRYYYTNATDFDSTLKWFFNSTNPFTHSKGYIIYDGVVSVGVDMSEIRYSVDNRKKTITVRLPKEKVLAHEIDNDSVKSDVKESIFNMLDAEYYAKLIGGLKEETEEKVLGNAEYIAQIRSNTEIILRNYVLSSDLTRDYTVSFEWE